MPLKRRQLVAHAGEALVDADRRLRLERRVEQRDLRQLEAHVIAGRLADAGDAGPAPQPLLRHDPGRPVVQRHRGAAVAERLEQARQRHDLAAAEVDRAVELEPVDPGSDVGPHRLDGSEGAPFGFDPPAFGDELADRGGKAIDGDREVLAGGLVVPLPPEPGLREPIERRLLGGDVAADRAAAARIERASRRIRETRRDRRSRT